MKETFLNIACCPGCGGAPLELRGARKRKGKEILDGSLHCGGCGKSYKIIGGVPCFTSDAGYSDTFGLEWNFFRDTQIDSRKDTESAETFDRKTGWDEAALRGRLTLDAGCGAGRFAEVVSRRGAEVAGIDLSSAVHAAYRNIGHRENVHIARADIYNPPFRPGTFDLAYSIGVLPFTPDPREAFLKIPPLVKPGGRVAVWTYNTNDEEFIRRAEKWRALTTKLPAPALLALSLASAPLYHLYRNENFNGPAPGKLRDALPYIPMYPEWKKRWLDTFDFYSPKYQDMRGTYSRVAGWFEEAGLCDITFLPAETSAQGRVPDAGARANKFLDRIKSMRESLAGRELVIFGTGAAGRSAYKAFKKLGANIAAFAETTPRSREFLLLPVLSPDEIRGKAPAALIAICSEYGLPDISKTLRGLGFSEWTDFFFYAYLL